MCVANETPTDPLWENLSDSQGMKPCSCDSKRRCRRSGDMWRGLYPWKSMHQKSYENPMFIPLRDSKSSTSYQQVQFVVIGSFFPATEFISDRPLLRPPVSTPRRTSGISYRHVSGFTVTCCKSNQWELTFWQKSHKCFERCHQILQELTVDDCPSCVNLEFGNGICLNVVYPGWRVRELSQAWDLKMDICHLEKKWLKIGCSVLTCSFWFQKPSGHIKSNDFVINRLGRWFLGISSAHPHHSSMIPAKKFVTRTGLR